MMADAQYFTDGAAYERMMGVWSRLVGEQFLDWLALPPGLSCVDVGCGNGAFTELLVERCKPFEVQGIDPSPEQIAFARKRHAAKGAEFHVGNAVALPFPDDRFDMAIMALVIFFVPDPAKGVAEMVRVVRPGGIVAAYAWDLPGGGLPMQPILSEVRAMGRATLGPPVPEISRADALRAAWKDAGLEGVETRAITVQRTFADIDDFWTTSTLSGTIRTTVAALSDKEIAVIKDRLRTKLSTDARGRITHVSFANAVIGRVPK
jgi:SAM-dependent methyltransferase